MDKSKKFYVTTPIYYATGKPHLGHLYSTVLADVQARWHKIQNINTFFLTGTDEFGQKVAQAAEKANKDTKAFIDEFIPAYKNLWKNYEIDYTHFIRTTDTYHIKAVQQWLSDLMQKGDIYKGAYEGWYCTPCETYLTEKDFEKDVKNPLCSSCERATQWVSEECYFFKLSEYQEKLLQFYKENPNFITPKERAAEVVAFVAGGLQDLSISRTTLKWGVPFPGDEKHVTYVWADALNNYITGIGYGQKSKEEEFQKWWPADMQILGKDIVRFHAIFWPAFLMASGLALPKKLLVHGWIKVGDQKMSKSRNNSVDPQGLYEQYGADAVRYYLMRQMAITQDGNFSLDDLEQKITSDLANDLGNLLQRMVMLADKNGISEISARTWTNQEKELKEASDEMESVFRKEMNRGFCHMALGAVWKFLNQSNAYFHQNEPWLLARSDRDAFHRVLSATCYSLRAAAILLWPVMPKKMEELFLRIGYPFSLDVNHVAVIGATWDGVFTLQKGEPLFEKPELKNQELDNVEESTKIKEEKYITIDDVIKVELRAGTIIECEEVAESDKLLKMLVDFGEQGKRQIFAGVKKYYSPDDLKGQQGVFVTNLKPRKMLGQESQGMMLTTKDAEGTVAMVRPGKNAVNGILLQ
ncbi:methionine--tRNA ligase [Candidatus Babeliales bacterium]|nr:methionine--tRNA ligase [Candidatus Babeliales bacterium]